MTLVARFADQSSITALITARWIFQGTNFIVLSDGLGMNKEGMKEEDKKIFENLKGK